MCRDKRIDMAKTVKLALFKFILLMNILYAACSNINGCGFPV